MILHTTVHHIRDLIESHKLEIGCSGNIFSNNLPSLSRCIYPYWISHTWTFMRYNNLFLEEGTAHLHPQRQNNSFIVEYFIAAGIGGYLLSKLNMCHLALHASCRSNISIGDGKAISLNSLKYKKNYTLDQYLWIPQPIPHLK